MELVRPSATLFAFVEETLVMAFIRVEEGESIDHALRRFRRSVQRENILRDAKRHAHFVKPGERRRAKEAAARRRWRRRLRRMMAD